jgi:hypothetical protein
MLRVVKRIAGSYDRAHLCYESGPTAGHLSCAVRKIVVDYEGKCNGEASTMRDKGGFWTNFIRSDSVRFYFIYGWNLRIFQYFCS